jgi:hypothetical protein
VSSKGVLQGCPPGCPPGRSPSPFYLFIENLIHSLFILDSAK